MGGPHIMFTSHIYQILGAHIRGEHDSPTEAPLRVASSLRLWVGSVRRCEGGQRRGGLLAHAMMVLEELHGIENGFPHLVDTLG